MQAPAAFTRQALRTLVDFALPPRCPGCGMVTADPHAFCMTCWLELRLLSDPCCALCGLPFAHDAGPGALCGACLADPPSFDRLRAATAYGDISRRVALKLKYSGRPALARTIARFLVRHVDGQDGAILAPVPLHRWRIWGRGYNQSALIAAALAPRVDLSHVPDLLERVRATPPLRGMNRRARAEAVRGAFRVAPRHAKHMSGLCVILVDDVYTSGATARACAKVLKRAGVRRVDIVCWARVVRDSAD